MTQAICNLTQWDRLYNEFLVGLGQYQESFQNFSYA